MKKAIRAAVYDAVLRLEAYRLQGTAQPFPNHFHDYYVLGLVERGTRTLSCKNQTYTVQPGHILLFNPGDNHSCTQADGGVLDYLGLNISQGVMLDLAKEITGHSSLPRFSRSVIADEEAACCLRALHREIMDGSQKLGKEENLLFLLSRLLRICGQPFGSHVPSCKAEIETACAFMEQHYAQHIDLAQLCRHTGLSKSTLLRSFAKAKGVTPYAYLENIRVGKAKRLLEQGVPPVEAALRTGFSDQSHFSNYFSRFIGLTPGAYQEIFRKEGDG